MFRHLILVFFLFAFSLNAHAEATFELSLCQRLLFAIGNQTELPARAWMRNFSSRYLPKKPKRSIARGTFENLEQAQNYFLNSEFHMGSELEIFNPVTLQFKMQSGRSEEFVEVGKAVVAAFKDTAAIEAWRDDVVKEAIELLWNKGLRRKTEFMNPNTAGIALDLVLVRRGSAHGFQARSNGMPYGLHSMNKAIFYNTLAKKRLFIDWVGPDLSGAGTHEHHARGHLMQMVYAAETVPGFDRFIETIGENRDVDAWIDLFDNFGSGAASMMARSMFWSGRWVAMFQYVLPIEH